MVVSAPAENPPSAGTTLIWNPDGRGVGAGVGAAVGADVGAGVGPAVGPGVGAGVGTAVAGALTSPPQATKTVDHKAATVPRRRKRSIESDMKTP